MFPQHVFHILRQLCRELHLLPCDRMGEAQSVGMQRLTLYELHVRVIQVVSHKGMSDMF